MCIIVTGIHVHMLYIYIQWIQLISKMDGINIHSTSVTSVNLCINRKSLNLFATIYVAKQLKSTIECLQIIVIYLPVHGELLVT